MFVTFRSFCRHLMERTRSRIAPVPIKDPEPIMDDSWSNLTVYTSEEMDRDLEKQVAFYQSIVGVPIWEVILAAGLVIDNCGANILKESMPALFAIYNQRKQ